MDTARTSPDPALSLLESAASSARSGFGCVFSTSDEYETALISERRAAGRYDRSFLPVLMFVACASAIAGVALWFD
jgi:hypothetical protein